MERLSIVTVVFLRESHWTFYSITDSSDRSSDIYREFAQPSILVLDILLMPS